MGFDSSLSDSLLALSVCPVGADVRSAPGARRHYTEVLQHERVDPLDYRTVKRDLCFYLGNSPRAFWGEVPGALKNHLNTVELTRITITSLAAGGGVLGLLQALLASVGTIFPAPSDAALAAVILTLILDSLRRLDHGQEPAPAGLVRFPVPGATNGSLDRT
jgi:hypothetical protein